MTPENWPEPDGHAMRIVESTAGYTIRQMGYAWSEKLVREIVRMEVEAVASLVESEWTNPAEKIYGKELGELIRARLKENKDAD